MHQTATSCVGCGHDADAHPRVGTKDHSAPVTWSTECVQCDAAGDYCPEYVVELGGPIVEPVDVTLDETAEPLEERLRTGLVGAGIAALASGVVLLVAAFGLSVAARWATDSRPLDGTALLCVLAALVAGLLGWRAVQFGIGGGPDVVVEPEQVEPSNGFVDGPRLPPAGESGVSRSADGGR